MVKVNREFISLWDDYEEVVRKYMTKRNGSYINESINDLRQAWREEISANGVTECCELINSYIQDINDMEAMWERSR